MDKSAQNWQAQYPPDNIQPLDVADLKASEFPEKGAPVIRATPFVWRDPSTIPLRQWIYGRQLLRGTVTLLIAPGATGKSALVSGMAIAMATGQPHLGQQVWDRPQRVWVWNLEDDTDELDRSLHAAALHWGVSESDLDNRLFRDSGLDGDGLCMASSDEKGTIIRPVTEALARELRNREIDVLIVDPFISSHAVDENDNPAIDAIVKEWGRIATRLGCAIVLVHHTRKQQTREVDAESSRGAKALVDGARSVVALNRMSPDEADQFGIPEMERTRYFRADAGAKPNRAPPPGKADWYHLASQSLGNGPMGSAGDSIAVATPWSPPDAFEGVTTEHLRKVQAIVADGDYRDSVQAADWAGKVVADVLGLDLSTKADKRRASRILKEWKGNGAFAVEHKADRKGDMRPFLVVGRLAE